MTVQVISSPVFAVSLPLVLHPAPGLNFGKHTFCIQQFDCFLVASRINFRRLSLASHPSDLSKLPLLTGTLVLLHLSIYCGPNRACAFVSLRLLFSVKYGIFQYGTLIVLLPPPGGESILSALLWSSWGSMAVVCSSCPPTPPPQADVRNWLTLLYVALSCHRALHILST